MYKAGCICTTPTHDPEFCDCKAHRPITREVLFKSVTDKAWAIQQSRMTNYGEEWKSRPADTHIASAYYKTARALYNKTDPEKVKDDLLDALNAIVFALGVLDE